MLQRVQVLCEVYILILQLVSALSDLVQGPLVLTELVLEKRRQNQANRAGNVGRK